MYKSNSNNSGCYSCISLSTLKHSLQRNVKRRKASVMKPICSSLFNCLNHSRNRKQYTCIIPVSPHIFTITSSMQRLNLRELMRMWVNQKILKNKFTFLWTEDFLSLKIKINELISSMRKFRMTCITYFIARGYLTAWCLKKDYVPWM